MPLVYDDIPGSWGKLSKGWPFTYENAYEKYVFLNKLSPKARPVPYGSYVFHNGQLRIESQELLCILEEEYKKAGSPRLGDIRIRYEQAVKITKGSSEWPMLEKWW